MKPCGRKAARESILLLMTSLIRTNMFQQVFKKSWGADSGDDGRRE